MGDKDTTEYAYYDTARRVFAWTALVDREAPDALGHASVELADRGATTVVHLTSGNVSEGFDIRIED
jgi:hypothetical protein